MPIRVVVDARLITGTGGGVESVIVGLASGLSALQDGPEEYSFLTYGGADGWLRPYLTGPCRAMPIPMPLPIRVKSWAARMPVLRRDLWRRVTSVLGWEGGGPARSDGHLERAGVDVVHFVRQEAFLTAIPSIYHPHDLQHRHLPEFFTPHERAVRDRLYRAFCGQARMVAVTAAWGKRDLIEQYGLPADRIEVVPWAPPIQAYPEPRAEDLSTVRLQHGLPEEFVFYAAQTWPHKNHRGLIDALAWIRDQTGRLIPFVSSGRRNEHYAQLYRRVAELGMEAQVRFLGYVSPVELKSLYRLSRCVIIPTRFEAASGPLWEAFEAGIPAACSRVTSLPDQAGDAALLFDPDRPEEIGRALLRLWDEPDLRATLVARGRARVAQFTWGRTAHLFRAHYRRIAGRDFTDQDRALLAEAPGI